MRHRGDQSGRLAIRCTILMQSLLVKLTIKRSKCRLNLRGWLVYPMSCFKKASLSLCARENETETAGSWASGKRLQLVWHIAFKHKIETWSSKFEIQRNDQSACELTVISKANRWWLTRSATDSVRRFAVWICWVNWRSRQWFGNLVVAEWRVLCQLMDQV